MSKAITGILLTVAGVALTAIGNPLGSVLISAGLAQVTQALFGPKLPKPDSADRTLKSPTPPRVRGYGERRLFGASVLFETASNGMTVDVAAVYDGHANALVQWYLNDDKVAVSGGYATAGADGRYRSNTVRLDYRLGLPTETVYSFVTAALPGIWTSNHRGDGVTSLAMTKRTVSAKNFLEVYPQGDGTTVSAAFQLALVYDPRDGGQDPDDPTTWEYSENALLHYLHFEMTDGGYDYATEILPAISYWIVAADICDEAIPLKAGGTEPRYRGCVIYQATDEKKAVRAELLSTFDGWSARRSDGALVVYAGKYYTPTITLGPDEIIEATAQSFVESEGIVNELIISYVSKDHDYAQPEGEAWRDEDSIALVGLNSQTFAPQTPSFSQNRRLGKRSMALINSPDRGTVKTNLGGRAAQGQRFINLDLTEDGVTFYSGPVQIQAAERFFGEAGGMTFEWVKVDPNMDAWNAATEEGEPATTASRVAPAPLDAPEITSAVPEYSFDSGAGTAGVCINLEVDGPDRDDLIWFLRTRVVGAAVWGEREYSDIDPGPAVELVTEFVPTDASVEVQAAYQVGDGRISPWSDSEIVDTSTAGIAPAPASDMSADPGGAGEAVITWRNPASPSLAYLRVYRGTTNVFGSATLISGDILGGLSEVMTVTETGVAADTYWYFVRAFNASGVGSTVVSDSVVVT